ncbi:hypothetical protein S101359_02394 [Bacillus atrophaeus]|nr:hypothetical protein S101359_02394 [Bacillus atrophaeus]
MTYGSSEYYVYAVLSAIKNPLQVKVFHPESADSFTWLGIIITGLYLNWFYAGQFTA